MGDLEKSSGSQLPTGPPLDMWPFRDAPEDEGSSLLCPFLSVTLLSETNRSFKKLISIIFAIGNIFETLNMWKNVEQNST